MAAVGEACEHIGGGDARDGGIVLEESRGFIDQLVILLVGRLELGGAVDHPSLEFMVEAADLHLRALALGDIGEHDDEVAGLRPAGGGVQPEAQGR